MSALAKVASPLLVVGTIVAALGGARLPDVHLPTVIVGLVLLTVGTVASKLTARSARQASAGSASHGDVLTSLRELPEKVAAIEAVAAAAPLPDLATRLADLQRDALDPLSERAPGLLTSLGGDTFARVFGPYASAERAIGRARSAATDGHRPEAIAALATANEAIARAVDAAGPRPVTT